MCIRDRLGAAGLPNIGVLYPDTAPEYLDADSLELLRDVCARVREDVYKRQIRTVRCWKVILARSAIST